MNHTPDCQAALAETHKDPLQFPPDEFGMALCEVYVADDDMTCPKRLAAGIRSRHPLHHGGGHWKAGRVIGLYVVVEFDDGSRATFHPSHHANIRPTSPPAPLAEPNACLPACPHCSGPLLQPHRLGMSDTPYWCPKCKQPTAAPAHSSPTTTPTP